jgi:hypothetical protein
MSLLFSRAADYFRGKSGVKLLELAEIAKPSSKP